MSRLEDKAGNSSLNPKLHKLSKSTFIYFFVSVKWSNMQDENFFQFRLYHIAYNLKFIQKDKGNLVGIPQKTASSN